MKKDRITKMYEGLTNKEKALLAFHNLTIANEIEMNRIAGSVPIKAYDFPDIEYQRWFDGFFNIATLFTMEHWRTLSLKLRAQIGVLSKIRSKEDEEAEEMIKAHNLLESRLLALDCALLSVCEEHGIDPDAVRRLAGTEVYSPMSAGLKFDAEFQKEMTINMSRLLKC